MADARNGLPAEEGSINPVQEGETAAKVETTQEPTQATDNQGQRGVCRIKKEYLRKYRDELAKAEADVAMAEADASSSSTLKREREGVDADAEADYGVEAAGDEAKLKKVKTEHEDGDGQANEGDGGGEAEEPSAEKRQKRRRGQNKKREITRSSDLVQLCHNTSQGQPCARPDNCKYSHDIHLYMHHKGPDIGDVCPVFELYGKCKYGAKCRFAQAHTDKDYQQTVNEEVARNAPPVPAGVTRDFQRLVRQAKIPLERSTQYLRLHEQNLRGRARVWALTEQAKLEQRAAQEANGEASPLTDEVKVEKEANGEASLLTHEVKVEKEINGEASSLTHEVKVENMAKLDQHAVKIVGPHPNKKTIDFRGKTYLAPLTTVGNLPFRRVCKGFGVDITCGEMAMATNLLSGQSAEWALIKRHPCEDIFGVQIAGGKTEHVVKACEAIQQAGIQCGTIVDFVDLNVGCPVDAITRVGCGSALLEKKAKLFDILAGANYVLECPVTCKLRTGTFTDKPIAHKLIEAIRGNVSLCTLHGRSKQQRYTKLANWDYISDFGSKAEGSFTFFGNGDILNWEEYYGRLERAKVDGLMIGRGALIKPWIFEEIKDRKVKDISATERFEILKDFAKFGLEHWGSDTPGVNTTRRFMCEWLSFLYRYVPVGLLEVLPQKINDRPPPFYGRNELETLMGSSNSADWVKITERILGKAPDDFKFVPKHKSNSYEANAYEADDIQAEG